MLKSTINESDITFHERVGFGASGEVYRITWKSKDGDVEAAAKKIPIDPNEPVEDQIGLEIEILQKLNHKNVIKYYGHIITDTYVTIITEFAAQGSLFEYLKGKSRLHSRQIHKWATEAAKGIQHLNDLGVLHRDVKSHNFLISADDTLKICDLGIAKYLTSTKTTKNEKGTVKWLAPEVVKEQKLSPKADVFAFGIVLWELVSCEEPYKGDQSPYVMYHVAAEGLRPKVPEGCPVGYKILMEQSWDGDRHKRPDIQEVVARLEAHDDTFIFACASPGKPHVSSTGFTSMTVHWDPPADDGGRSIIGYVLEYRVTASGTASATWTTASKDLIPTAPMTVNGLAESTRYEYRTSAVNVVGKGPTSEVSDEYMTKPCLPGIPKALQVSQILHSTMTVSWNPPDYDGSTPIKCYILEYKCTDTQTWNNAIQERVPTKSIEVSGLSGSTKYQFRVSAVNKVGTGAVCTPSNEYITDKPVVPGCPGKPKVSHIHFHRSTVSWTPPDDDGGCPVTGYILEYKDARSTTWIQVSENLMSFTSFTVDGLSAGVEYQFRVASVNKVGKGSISETSDVYMTKQPVAPGPPGKPHVFYIGNTEMTVSWSPPDDEGGTTISGYLLEYKTDELCWTRAESCHGLVTATSLKVHGLSAATKHQFRVVAQNTVGRGPTSKQSDVYVTEQLCVPGPPGNLQISDIHYNRATLSWTAPTNDGGSSIKGYHIDVKDANSTTWSTVNKNLVSNTFHKLTGLSAGIKYEIRVTAENNVGKGVASNSTEYTTKEFTVPGKCDKPKVSQLGFTKMTVFWAPPKDNGGTPICGYYLFMCKGGNVNTWTRINQHLMTNTSFVMSGLSAGTDYQFRVTTVNQVGEGTPSEPSDKHATKDVVEPRAPGKPKVVHVKYTEVSVMWTPSDEDDDDDGQSPIVGYILEYKLATSNEWIRATQELINCTTSKVSGLEGGAKYQFRVIAQNRAGKGLPSELSEDSVTKHPDVPGIPGNISVSHISTNKMTIFWTPPDDDGGSPISSYQLEYQVVKSDNWTCVSKDRVRRTSCVMTGLKAATRYQFRVAAINEVGKGPTSKPSDEHTTEKPLVSGPPGKPHVSKTEYTKVTVSWSLPEDNGGSPIIDYILEYKDVMSSNWSKATNNLVSTTSMRVDGLLPFTEYQFRVAAVNMVGTGSFSELSDAYGTFILPGLPGNPNVSNITQSSMTVSWTPPKDDGGSSICGYLLEYKEGTTWTRPSPTLITDTSFTVQHLNERHNYQFRVFAQNKVGKGPTSELSDVHSTLGPPGPSGKPKVSNITNSSMTVSWAAPEDDGGSPCNYILEYNLYKKSSTWTRPSPDLIIETLFTVKELNERHNYKFRVFAQNEFGKGPASELSEVHSTLGLPGSSGKPELSNITQSSMKVSWTPPKDDGGSSCGYILEYKTEKGTTWNRSSSDLIADTSFTVKHLHKRHNYQFRVFAQNKVGKGPASELSDLHSTIGSPGPPGKPQVSNITTSSMTVSWAAPEDDGGSPCGYILEYNLSRRLKSRTNHDFITKTSYTVKDLKKCHRYQFRVFAQNKVGRGPFSELSDLHSTLSPPGPPGKPQVSNITTSSMTVSWAAPKDDGGSPCGYILEYNLSRRTWIRPSPDLITKTSFTVKDLKERQTYQFRVLAQNSGKGPFSELSDLHSTLAPPGPPGKPQVSNITTSSMTVSWAAPEDDGGGSCSYILEYNLSRTTGIRTSPDLITNTSFTVKDLKKRHAYQFRVFAQNKFGKGPISEPSDLHSTLGPPGPPGKPQVSNITTSSMTVSWAAPEDDGGGSCSYILEYNLSRTTGIRTSPDLITNTSFTVKDLKKRHAYQFRVFAQNKFGKGPISEPSDLHSTLGPPGPPGKPQVSNITTSSMTVSWAAPEDDGGGSCSYILEYNLSRTTGIRTSPDLITNTSFTVKDLKERHAYQFCVFAQNKIGKGLFSELSDIHSTLGPPGPPGKPQASSITTSSMTVSWAAPEDDGGGSCSYILEYNLSRTTWIRTSPDLITNTSFTVKDLKGRHTYQFRVFAQNKFGKGPISEPSDLHSTLGPPGPPGKPQVSNITTSSMTVSWAVHEDDAGGPCGYILEYNLSRTTWIRTSPDLITNTSFTVKDLKGRHTYQFRVLAQNKFGKGLFSELSDLHSTLGPPGPPGRPRVSNRTTSSMTVSWAAPENDGGGVCGYILEYNLSRTTWIRTSPDLITKTSFTVKDLKERHAYQFRVLAQNKFGKGPISELSYLRSTLGPPGPPGQPEVTTTINSMRSMTVSWAVPKVDGGSSCGYILEYQQFENFWSVTSLLFPHETDVWTRFNPNFPGPTSLITDTSFTLTSNNFAKHGQYRFRVFAKNEFGEGPASEPSMRCSTPWSYLYRY